MNNPFDKGYYNSSELRAFGMKVGSNVFIAKDALITGLGNVEIGDDVRIDSFVTILVHNGFLNIGNNVHIGSYSYIACGAGVILGNYCGLSQGVKIYSKTDNYDGKTLTNPTVSIEYTRPIEGTVELEQHAIIGSGTIILPKVRIREGSSVGANSLVTKSLESWGVYFGSPVKRLKNRSKKLLDLQEEYEKDKNCN